MTRLIFGGAVVIILLGLYVYSVIYATEAVWCIQGTSCTQYNKDLTEGIKTILNLIGGLVSALVVAELAVTKPNTAPAARLLQTDATDLSKSIAAYISIAYISVWLICGLFSLIVGYLQHPDVVPALTASGKSWLGLAIASAYAYFGIKQE